MNNEPSEIEDEILENQDTPSDVTVDLGKKPDQKPDEKPKEEPKLPQDISKLHNTIAYQNRKLEQAMRKLEETQAQIASLREQRVAPVSQDVDEIEEIAKRDWKLGVKKVVEGDIESKVQEILAKRDLAQQELNSKKAKEDDLEKSKKRVIEKYPSIEDPNSEEQRIYLDVINEDDSLLRNVHGPEIAMYRMEERLRGMGRVPKGVQPMVDKEVNRLARAGASSVVGRQASSNGKVTLSKDQKEFCDHYKIPYDQYAKNLKADARGAE